MSKQSISAVVTKRWLRTCNIECDHFIQQLMDTVSIYFDDMNVNELFVNIAVVGDDHSDKLGLIYNYIYDYKCKELLQTDTKLQLIKQNESNILEFSKIVTLSSRNRVHISISCLSQFQKENVSSVCKSTTKSIIFCYNLCDQISLQNIRKWYKDCVKQSSSFISILVGTHYEEFKGKAANYRISVIEQSRKYANKMSAILLFISTANDEQINIKEIFLIILSRIFLFDCNISCISNSKLPIIEFYDIRKTKRKKKNKNANIHTHSNTLNKRIPMHKHMYRDHNRTKTSIEDIQNRLSIIRTNLKTKKTQKQQEKHNKKHNKVEQLYNRFEQNYHSFIAKQTVESGDNELDNNMMYPSFLHNNKDDNDDDMNGNNMALSELLKGDALGLNTLHQEKDDDFKGQNTEKQRKHERAMSMMPSLLHNNNNNNNNNMYNVHVPRHNRAMPSMPNFLSKLQHDHQLKNIISAKFTSTHSGINENNLNNPIASLHNKIQNLESSLQSYQQIIKENSKTVKVLKKTISKIEKQRDESTKRMNAATDKEEIKGLKGKNAELQSVADALAMNLIRKQQSLEEALHAMHSLNEAKQEINNKQKDKEMEMTKSKSVPTATSNSQDEELDVSSFRKGIARRLRNLSNSFSKPQQQNDNK